MGACYAGGMFGSLIKDSLEKEGSKLLGTAVRVAAASISPFSGQLSVESLTAANPPGFRSPEAFRIARLEAVASLSAPLDLGEVVADGVDVFLELGRAGSNLARLKRHMAAGEVPSLTIRRLLVRNGSVRATLFGRAAAFPLPELVLDRVDLRGVALALAGAAVAEARKRASRVRAMPRGRRRPAKKVE